ncbi:MAG TPA: hypothetical protein VFO93_02120 [Hymenobacter sp.]|nr:hypothetical protein [Hymenobacter sp.]
MAGRKGIAPAAQVGAAAATGGSQPLHNGSALLPALQAAVATLDAGVAVGGGRKLGLFASGTRVFVEAAALAGSTTRSTRA